MKDHLSREQNSHLAGLMREQLNEMMTAAHELGTSGILDEKGRDYLALINRGLCRQLRLTRHLELLHRLTDENEIRLRPQTLDLVALCRNLIAQVGGLLQVRGIHSTFHSRLTSLTVSADPNRMEDMLLCLISNSAHAVREGGTIDLTLELRSDRILLLVTDNGGGISNAAMAEFFECSYPDDEPGEITMKLGLPLARRIAALHGGLILADNYAGEGVRLAVLLPLLKADSPYQLHALPPDPSESGWNRALIELSDLLPPQCFTPEELNG